MSQQYQVTGIQEVSPEGMIFVRITYILTTMVRAPVIAACFVILALSSFVQYAIGTPKVLDFTIYTEGTVNVLYQTDSDPQLPDSTLNLFGSTIDNLVVQDENGTLLSSTVDGNVATVETLGSSIIKVNYDTSDLVSKNGKTWTFHINSPIDYSVLLPKNSVIIGMSVSPLNIQIVDGQSLISLPSGTSEINYIIGVLGTSQTATLAIQKTQDFIDNVTSTGVQTPMALAKLQEARADFNQGKYSDAESLANTAKNLAIQEQQTINSVPKTLPDNLSVSLLITVIIVAAGATGFVIMKRTRTRTRTRTSTVTLNDIPKSNYIAPDKETIYKLKPELRQDDKEIIAFISEKGGQVFESELRKKFLMPRTTMWRAVKRLEREDVIEIEKVDQQNLIKLRKIEEDEK